MHTIGRLLAEVLMNYEWENSRNEDMPEGRYANYFKVGQNAFEFLIDFGQFYPNDGKEHFHTRIVISPFYANVLFKILQESIDQYVQTFGPIPADGEDE
ncbi:DUF3467 domain-containing protein [Candidatus Brocadia sp. AMX2]|nr:DUF3467 domain-containing protein [Candidatus Brocadia sp. AMX2]